LLILLVALVNVLSGRGQGKVGAGNRAAIKADK